MIAAYFGNFDPPHSTENEYRRAFKELGWGVVPIQENGPDPLGVCEGLVNAVSIDLILYTRTWGFDAERATALWRKAESLGIPTAAVHLDRFWDLHREQVVYDDAMFRMGYVFTPEGDTPERWKDAGVNHYWLPPAVDRASCTPPQSHHSIRFPLLFAGSVNAYHPEWPHRKNLVAHLREKYGSDFYYRGPDDASTVREAALNELYARTDIVIGDSCFIDKTTLYWSDRVYETWGRGGFMLFPFNEHLASTAQLGPYPAWYPAEDLDALDEQIDYWVDVTHHEQRETIRQRIQDNVRENHTYTNRVESMIETIGIG